MEMLSQIVFTMRWIAGRLTVLFIVTQTCTSSSMSNLTDDCLHCICLASSECDPGVRCHSIGPVEYYCGPYQLSRQYWIESGSPGASSDNPFGQYHLSSTYNVQLVYDSSYVTNDFSHFNMTA